MTTCKPFKGPLTPIALTQWLASCEDGFELAAFERRGAVPDRLKITYAGDAIGTEAGTLYEWWIGRREELKELTWSAFVEEVYLWALGSSWKIGALEHFHRTEQGDKPIDQYITDLRAARLVVDRARITTIADFHYKSHLLFHSSRELAILVHSAPNFDLDNVSIAQLEQAMRVAAHNVGSDERGKASTSGSATFDDPPSYASSGSWELSELWGLDYPNSGPWSQFNDLPSRPDGVTRVASMSLSFDSYLKGLKVVLHSDGMQRNWTLESHNSVNHPPFQDLALEIGEYVNCVTFARPITAFVNGARIETNRGRNLTAGSIQATADTDTMVFRAKSGHKIVGFHGMYASVYISKIGVIYGPLLSGEK